MKNLWILAAPAFLVAGLFLNPRAVIGMAFAPGDVPLLERIGLVCFDW